MAIRVKGTRLVYFPVPKNACSSVKHSLLNHNEDGLADRLPAPGPKGREIRHPHQFYRTTPYRGYEPVLYFGTRWFCIVRDPVRRFLSGYGNRILHHDDLKRSKAGQLEALGLPRHPDLNEFALNLEKYIRICRPVRHHFLPSSRYLGTRPGRFDRIFPMQELPQIVPYCAQAGAVISLPHLQAKGAKLKPDDLTAQALAHVENYYAQDLRIWGPYTDG